MSGQTKAWHDERRLGIGGSDATKIMGGEWRELWAVKTGAAPDADLSRVLPVQMGVQTEPLNVRWFQEETGFAVSTDGCEHLTHPGYGFMRCNLDGRVLPDSIFEAKHVGDRFKLEEIVARHFWQLQHCMAVADSAQCYLSVFFGNSRWAYATVARDDSALLELITTEREFWGFVERDEEPEDRVKQAVQVNLDSMREVDMTGNNAWGAFSADWIECRAPAKRFQTADKGLKELMDGDVRRAWGHGVEIKRAVNGSMRIGEMK